MTPQRSSDSTLAPPNGSTGQPEMELPPNIPTERLLALLHASDEMIESVFHRSRQDTLNTLARSVKRLLQAEAAAIFLVDEESPDSLVLSAYQLDTAIKIEKLKLKIQDVPKGGMTGFIAHKGEIVRLHGTALQQHPNNAGSTTTHLKGGRGFSILGIPLKDRKGRVLGVAKVDNKKGADGAAGENDYFDEVDEFIARVLVNKIVLVLESLRNFNALRGIMEEMHHGREMEDVRKEILKIGMKLIGADRGDFLLWDPGKFQLVPAAQYGAGKTGFGEEWSKQGIVSEVWRTREAVLIGDVCSDKRYADKYYAAHPLTRSEVAIYLEFEGKPAGVLNAESFQLNWFDQHDLDLLQLLGRYATIATQVVGEEVAFRSLVQRLAEGSPSREELLNGILSSLASIFRLDAGLILIANHRDGTLQGSASIGCDELEIDPKAFKYQFDDKSLATKVLTDRTSYFSSRPKLDPQVNPLGLEAFQIDGPLVGVPLMYRGEAVGVLVCWSRRNYPPARKHIKSLEPFASLAATAIALWETQSQRTKVLLKIGEILDSMQTELSLAKNLRSILSGIQESGFDRVRAFEFKQDSNSFIGLASAGMANSKLVEGYIVSADKNPYARFTEQVWSSDPRARIYRSTMFGTDPDAKALGKDADLPWAVVPLVTTGTLYGYIAAENEQSKREITQDNLDYLTLYGALAGQAIANRHTLDVLSASKVRDDFLQRMAHIFITNTASIKLMVKNLEDGAVSYPQFQHYFQPAILRINKEFLALGQKMRDFAELGTDTKLNIGLVDMNLLVKHAIERLGAPALERDINIEVIPRFSSSLAIVDDTRAARAVEALLENAIKFSPKGSTVHVQIGATEGMTSVGVRDEGTGIPEEELPFVFDPFFRASNTKDKHVEGTGLGLSMVARTMELHGGTASVRNHPGGGAEFTLVFPRGEAEHRLD